MAAAAPPPPPTTGAAPVGAKAPPPPASAVAAAPSGAPPAAAGGTPPNALGQNKQDEPQFQMKIEPEAKFSFKSDKLTEVDSTVPVKLTNTTKSRQCFKVKTTSNDIFRVRPPLGFVNANESVTINIVFAAKEVPPPNRHFFAFYHTPCKDDDKNPRSVWTLQAKPEGVRRVIAEFLKEDGSPANGPPVAAASSAPPPAGGAAPAPVAPAAVGKSQVAPPPGGPPPAASPVPEKK